MNLSENVRAFPNKGFPTVLGGSAGIMVRSFYVPHCARRPEKTGHPYLRYNLQDNQNTYLMRENGSYVKRQPAEGEGPFNIHRELYKVNVAMTEEACLF